MYECMHICSVVLIEINLLVKRYATRDTYDTSFGYVLRHVRHECFFFDAAQYSCYMLSFATNAKYQLFKVANPLNIKVAFSQKIPWDLFF